MFASHPSYPAHHHCCLQPTLHIFATYFLPLFPTSTRIHLTAAPVLPVQLPQGTSGEKTASDASQPWISTSCR